MWIANSHKHYGNDTYDFPKLMGPWFFDLFLPLAQDDAAYDLLMAASFGACRHASTLMKAYTCVDS